MLLTCFIVFFVEK